MRAGYRFQIGWVRQHEDERRVRVPWTPVLLVLAVIAVVMIWFPLKPASAPAPHPVAHVQPAAPTPTVAAIQINGNAPVCVLPTGTAHPRTIELVKVP